MQNSYTITGQLVNKESGQSIQGLRTEAWDKDLRINDFADQDISDSNGFFKVSFTPETFRRSFIDQIPDLYFKMYSGTQFIHSTRKADLSDIENYVDYITLKIPKPETIKVKAQITGIVRAVNADEYPSKGLQYLNVKIFQVTLSAETLLQTTELDESGMFDFEIDVEKSTTLTGRLYLNASGDASEEILIAESGPHCPGGEVIALTYDFDVSKFGPPMYVAVTDAIAPHLGGLQLTALTEKQKEQLSCISGVDGRVLNRLIQAAKLQADMQLAFIACVQIPHSSANTNSTDAAYFNQAAASMTSYTNSNTTEAILFALIQNDNSMELHQVLTLSSGQFTQKINEAVAANIIAPISDILPVTQVFVFLRNCLLFNSQNDNRYYDAKLIALTKLNMTTKSIQLDHTIEAGSLNSFLAGEKQKSTSPALASA
jgi:hypothetical protein